MNRLNYIDGIKGFAILSVIFLHAFPISFLHYSFAFVHIWQAIPLFVFVPFFLLFTKMDLISIKNYYSWNRLKAMLRRIMLPYFFTELVILLYLICIGDWNELKSLLVVGGVGKGSYYPFLYCQIWLFAPLIWLLIKYLRSFWGVGSILVAITIIVNFFLVNKSERVYSCCVIRYLFMAIVAYVWYKNIKNFFMVIFFPLISILYWILLETDYIDFSKLVPNWWGQQFPSFFYTYLFVYLIYKIYSVTRKSTIKVCLEWLGRNSYEIFLMQMLFFYFFSQSKVGLNNGFIDIFFLYPCFAISSSIIPVVLYRKILVYVSTK